MKYHNNVYSNSNGFEKTVNFLIHFFQVEEIIETGTYDGKGSSYVFAKTGLPVTTMEINSKFYALAVDRLKDFPNVKVLNASSLFLNDMKNFISNDFYLFPDWIKHDIPNGFNEKKFYLDEISQDIKEENVLFNLIDNEKKQLVFLDSAGGVGYLEFKELLKLSEDKLKRKVLLLDDVFHVKHYRSVLELESMKNIPFLTQEARFAWYKF